MIPARCFLGQSGRDSLAEGNCSDTGDGWALKKQLRKQAPGHKLKYVAQSHSPALHRETRALKTHPGVKGSKAPTEAEGSKANNKGGYILRR